MRYRITGLGDGPVEGSHPTLEAAARSAAKMVDQGVRDVGVFGKAGREIPADEWRQAWWRWAKREGRNPE